MNSTLPVHERFATWQGEGAHHGRPAFFVRLFGCPVKCPWCDSAGTWHPDYVPKNVERLTVAQIVEEIQAARMPRLVVTGGEPTIHDLTGLSTACSNRRIATHIETSGAFAIRGDFDWVTVSPKRWAKLEPSVAMLADEFKIVVADLSDVEFYLNKIQEALGFPWPEIRVPIWLHPEWSKRDDPKILAHICHMVTRFSELDLFRAGFQLHKLFGVDALDARSRPLVPLGGNPKLGY